LDICSGLGYNTASCIECLGDEVNIKIDMVEISLETLALTLLLEAPLESYRIIQKSVEDKLYGDGNIKCRHFEEEVPENIRIDIHIDDARVAVGNLVDDKTYDAIFLDPFSPLKSPELYTVEFFRLLKSLLKPDGII